MKEKKKFIVVALAIVAIGVALLAVFYNRPEKVKETVPKRAQNAQVKKTRKAAVKSVHTNRLARIKGNKPSKVAPSAKTAPSAAPEEVDPMEALFGNVAPAEKALAIKVQEAWDGNDAERVFPIALKELECQAPEVRLHAVNALSWCGGKSLPHLTKMLADADSEVAERALSVVEDLLMGMDDPLTKFKAAALYMNDYKDNADARSVFSGILSSSGGDLLETAESRKMVIDTIVGIMQNGGESREEAQEIFRSITGVEWKNQGEANKWVADPEAYAQTID